MAVLWRIHQNVTGHLLTRIFAGFVVHSKMCLSSMARPQRLFLRNQPNATRSYQMRKKMNYLNDSSFLVSASHSNSLIQNMALVLT